MLYHCMSYDLSSQDVESEITTCRTSQTLFNTSCAKFRALLLQRISRNDCHGKTSVLHKSYVMVSLVNSEDSAAATCLSCSTIAWAMTSALRMWKVKLQPAALPKLCSTPLVQSSEPCCSGCAETSHYASSFNDGLSHLVLGSGDLSERDPLAIPEIDVETLGTCGKGPSPLPSRSLSPHRPPIQGDEWTVMRQYSHDILISNILFHISYFMIFRSSLKLKF